MGLHCNLTISICTSISICGEEHCPPVVTDIDVLSHADDIESSVNALDLISPQPLVIYVVLISLQVCSLEL